MCGLPKSPRWRSTCGARCNPLIATSAGEGIEAIEQNQPDVVLLHPDFDDLTLSQAIQEIRRFSQAPMLVLGRYGDEMEVVTSLELGAR